MKRFLLALFVLAAFTASARQQSSPFSTDSAAAALRAIAVDIGPRPMGSPAERRSMEYALDRFRAYGLNELYILPMHSIVRRGAEGGALNTSSGTAVGILRGKTNRTIVIGAHLDSADPEIAGANDDGSGAAVVIELARVLSKRANESTIVFALFGGEEMGTRGSEAFVELFPGMKDVVLMLQVDMANGTGWLIPLVDVNKVAAPRWLVNAAYEEFHAIGKGSIVTPTHFMAVNSLMPGGAIGSDHMPFLKKGIPAIDFTTDMNDPIHTQQDTYANFQIDGLKRSGDLVYRLVERFDKGVPEGPKTESYFFTQLLGNPLYLPFWGIYTLLFAAVALSVLVLLNLRAKRPDRIAGTREEQKSTRPKVPGLKLFALMLLVQILLWFSDNIIGLLAGAANPLYAHPEPFYLFGAAAALLGCWLALRAAPAMDLSADPYRYYLRAVVFLLIFIALIAVSSPQLALYPAAALMLFAAAMHLHRPALKLVFALCAPYLMMRAFFSEGFTMILRMGTAAAGESTFAGTLLTNLLYILISSIWMFPLFLGAAAVYFDVKNSVWTLRKAAGAVGGGIVLALVLVCGIYAFVQPAYTREWTQTIRIRQDVYEKSGSRTITVTGSDYLKGARITHAGRDTVITERTGSVVLKPTGTDGLDWIRSSHTVETFSDSSGKRVTLMLKLSLKYRPYTLMLSIGAGKEKIDNLSSTLAGGTAAGKAVFHWYSFPDTSLLIPLSFTAGKADTLTETIQAEFLEQVEPVTVQMENSAVFHRTTITRTLAIPLTKK